MTRDTFDAIMFGSFVITILMIAVLMAVQAEQRRGGREDVREQMTIVYMASVFATVGLGCLVFALIGGTKMLSGG